jgi:hypothetical protein
MRRRVSQCLALIVPASDDSALHDHYCSYWHLGAAERLLCLMQRLAHEVLVDE